TAGGRREGADMGTAVTDHHVVQLHPRMRFQGAIGHPEAHAQLARVGAVPAQHALHGEPPYQAGRPYGAILRCTGESPFILGGGAEVRLGYRYRRVRLVRHLQKLAWWPLPARNLAREQGVLSFHEQSHLTRREASRAPEYPQRPHHHSAGTTRPLPASSSSRPLTSNSMSRMSTSG